MPRLCRWPAAASVSGVWASTARSRVVAAPFNLLHAATPTYFMDEQGWQLPLDAHPAHEHNLLHDNHAFLTPNHSQRQAKVVAGKAL